MRRDLVRLCLANYQTNNSTEKLLAVALASFADSNGERIFPSVETLAAFIGKDERTVQRYRSKMVENGFLVKVGISQNGQTLEFRIANDWIECAESRSLSLKANKANRRGLQSIDSQALPSLPHVNLGGGRVTPVSTMGDIAVSSKGDIAVSSKGDIAVSSKGDIAVPPNTSLSTYNNHQSGTDPDDNNIKYPSELNLALANYLASLETPLKVNPNDPKLTEWIKMGVTLNELMQAVMKTSDKVKNRSSGLNLGYLNAIFINNRLGVKSGEYQLSVEDDSWLLDGEKIVSRAYRDKKVGVTETDRNKINSKEYQELLLKRLGLTERQWAVWRSYREGV